MNKKINLLIAILLGLVCDVCAQFTFGKPSTELIIEKTIRDAFVVVEQQYQLKEIKSGNYYGRNNRDEFGSVYSLGILTQSGLVVGNRVLNPWEYDPNYNRYKDNEAYEPVLFLTNVKNSGGALKKLNCDIANPVDLKNAIYDLPCQADSTGLGIIDTTGVVDGWLLWAWIPTGTEIDSNTELSFTIVPKKEFEMKEDVQLETPQTVEKVVGCFFILPNIPQVGTLTFRICGMAYKSDKEWLFKPVTKDWCDRSRLEKETPVEAEDEKEVVAEKEEEDALTPVGKDQKDKKKGNKKGKK